MKNRPVPILGTDFYFHAYNELQTERQIGMAAGNIPWSKIVAYAAFNNITDADDVSDFVSIIRAVESAMSEYERKSDK